MPDEDATKGHQPHRVRLPGFVTEEDMGLGDVVKRVTYAMGIKPCGRCEVARGGNESLDGVLGSPFPIAGGE